MKRGHTISAMLPALMLALSLGWASIAAQESAPARPMPCGEIDEFSQFDFWLGDWDVRNGDGELLGTNRITRMADGCVLLEEWQSVRGGSGISVNYYDPAEAQWVQVWNGSGGTQLTIRGGLDEEGAMRLAGELYYVGSGRQVGFRGLWQPLSDGRIRQYFEYSEDDGATWQPWFEGFYTATGTDTETNQAEVSPE